MADTKDLLPPNLQGDINIEALCAAIDVACSLEDDLSKLSVYDIDNVPAAVLPLLAWQFHVTDQEGWDLAATEAQRRALIKRAIELHRYKGTPWAVKEAIKAVGYADVQLAERLPIVRRNGEVLRDGSVSRFGGSRWAEFSVGVDLGESAGIDAASMTALRQLIDSVKPVSRHLRSVTYSSTMADAVDMEENSPLQIAATDSDLACFGVCRNGSILRNQATADEQRDRILRNGVWHRNGEQFRSGYSKYRRYINIGIRRNNGRDPEIVNPIAVSTSDEYSCLSLRDGRAVRDGYRLRGDASARPADICESAITRRVFRNGHHRRDGTMRRSEESTQRLVA